MFQTKGMNTWMDQDHDRHSWSDIVKYRKELIRKLNDRGNCPKDPHTLKLKKLESLMNKKPRNRKERVTDVR